MSTLGKRVFEFARCCIVVSILPMVDKLEALPKSGDLGGWFGLGHKA